MPIYKRCSRCGKRIQSGSRCECIKNRYKDYDKRFRDQKSKKFYHSSEWEKKRQYILEIDGGIDVYLYMTAGEIKAADTVHHIEPLRNAWERRFDDLNLMSVHHDTHSMIEKMYTNDKQKAENELKNMLLEYRKNICGQIR